MAPDFVLVRCVAPDAAGLAQAARAWCAQSGLALHRAAREPESGVSYVYGAVAAGEMPGGEGLQRLQGLWCEALPSVLDTQVSRLERVFDAPGHSRGEVPQFHYVVEMDPQAGWMPEIARWYDQEHMPGLASVPGTVHAMRLLNGDHGPLSLACYDLVTRETLGSPAWLAVRGTAWSDAMRPKFTNTRRTMLHVLL